MIMVAQVVGRMSTLMNEAGVTCGVSGWHFGFILGRFCFRNLIRI